jgi:hypothetical protein
VSVEAPTEKVYVANAANAEFSCKLTGFPYLGTFGITAKIGISGRAVGLITKCRFPLLCFP